MSTLRERCLTWCNDERERGVRSELHYPQKNWSPGIAEYLRLCVRDTNHDGVIDGKDDDIGAWLAKPNVGGNWCAASQSAALTACRLPGDIKPHLHRAGVLEIEADARESGTLVTVEQWLSEEVEILPGDLALWLRPGGAAWWRHVNRVQEISRARMHLMTIGGNERRQWSITTQDKKKIKARLYAFVRYLDPPPGAVSRTEPTLPAVPNIQAPLLSDREIANLRAQISDCTAELMRGLHE